MAEKRTIELEIKSNLSVAEKQIKNLGSAVKKLDNEVTDLDATFEEIYGDLKPLTARLGEAEDRLYELAKAGKQSSKEYKDLLNSVSEYKKIQQQTDLIVDAASQTIGSKLSGSLNTAAGGFSLVQGSMALFGNESESIEKAILKVQSAMAISQGIETIRESSKSLIALGSVAKTTFAGMTAASKAFMVGGIGLLITAIGLLVANWDNLTQSASKAAEEQRKLAAQTKAVAEAAKEQREAVSKESAEFATLIARLKDTNAGSKEREDLIKKVNAQYGTTLKNLKDETAFQSSLNSELANYLEYQKAKYILQSREELITKNLAKQDELNAKINKDKKELIRLTKEQEKADKEAGKASQQTVTGGGTAGGFGGATTYQESYEKAAKKSSLAVKEQQQSIKDLEQQLESAKQRFDNYGSAANNAQNNIDKLTNGGKKYVEQIENEIKVTKEATEKINKNAIEGRLELKTIKEVDNLDSLDMLKEQVDAEALINKEARDKELEADKAARLKTEVEIRNKKLQLAASAFDALGALAGSFNAKNESDARKQFKIQKAFNMASAITNTALAVSSALALLPGQVVFPGQRFVEAGIAGVAGLAAVANIAKTQFNSSGGGSMNSPTAPTGGGGVSAPNFNIVGNSGINQLAELGGQPIQAYVVSGEVTSAQALDRNRIQNATF
jgi:hypothetical protein